MRCIFLAFFMIIIFVSFSQKTEKKQISVAIACGIIGDTSPEIIALRRLDSVKSYGIIRQRLYNGSDLEKHVVTIMMEEYRESKKIILSVTEIETMNKIKKSTQKYSLCYTCTVHIDGTFADIFKKRSSKNQLVFDPYDIIKQSVLNS